jgi:hypothetical protein
MKSHKLKLLAAGVSLAVAQIASAGTDTYFVPLTASAAVTMPNSNEELTAPWEAPAGLIQSNLTSLHEVEDAAHQSVVRVPGLGTGASMMDMIAFDDTGDYLFIPHETFVGAGVTRYDIANDRSDVLFRGDLEGLNGDWSNDWGAFDPSTWTTNGTLFLAEEWSGEGRVMEVLNPMADPADIEIRELESIANVSHEGLRFSNDGGALYFVDEDRSGSIYKLVFNDPSDYAKGGTTYVLTATNFAGDPTENYNHPANSGEARWGQANWTPITDADGNPLTATDPFDNAGGPGNRAGRRAADEVNGTPYGRPEDIEVGTLDNGNEVLYFAATSERTVYSVEMLDNNEAIVREFASDANTPKNAGFPATSGEMNSPDNLAQDHYGNIYVIEDAPNGSDVGGDVWFARDTDGDGVAESLDHMLSNRVDGSESTGMIFHPVDGNKFAIAIQHPDSTDLSQVPEGHGDAIWMFEIPHNMLNPSVEKRGMNPSVKNANARARFKR